jgi:hypothetical protein
MSVNSGFQSVGFLFSDGENRLLDTLDLVLKKSGASDSKLLEHSFFQVF